MHVRRHLTLPWIFALIFTLNALPNAFAANLAPIEASENLVVWSPLEGYDVVLSVSGPGDYVRLAFVDGETPQLSNLTAEGLPLLDGSYTWQLIAIPADSRRLRADASTQPMRRSGYLTVINGAFFHPDPAAEVVPTAPPSVAGEKAYVVADDLIVKGSACIGKGCTTSEIFGSDTLRLKDSVIRQKFEDTSGTGFPTNDWQITINDPTLGSADKFSIEDVDHATIPFTLEGGAPSDAVYVDDGGSVGIGTSTPVGSLHVQRSDGTASIHVEETTSTSGVYTLLDLETTGSMGTNIRPRMTMTHGGVGTRWNLDILNVTGNFAIIRGGSGGSGPELSLDATNGDMRILGSRGNVFIPGAFISNGTTLNVPDFVFDEDYELMPLDAVKTFIEQESHLPNIPSAEQVKAEGLDLTDMQLKLLQKVEELTLYTLDQHDTIRQQQQTIQQMAERLEALEIAQE